MPLGRYAPLSHLARLTHLCSGSDRLADAARFANLLDLCRLDFSGAVRQDSSNRRMVALSIEPPSCKDFAEICTDSSIPLLYFCLRAMADFPEHLVFHNLA